MLPDRRRKQLLDILTNNGGSAVDSLVKAFNVSPATVRRDLQLLERYGHIKRIHGGATLPYQSPAFFPLAEGKAREYMEEKQAIARAVSERVTNGEVIILDSGSTALAVAKALKSKRNLTVISTDLKIALELSNVPRFNVVSVGGTVIPGVYNVGGVIAENTLRSLHASHAFVGADGIDLKGGMTSSRILQVPIKRLVMACSRKVTLIADHNKFGRVHLMKVAAMSEFDDIITDDGLDPSHANSYQEAGVDLTLAPLQLERPAKSHRAQ
ncbi:MAG: DeoR/GlpR family DNA-binding transcription regulator [Trueperaceae bacterium]